MSPASPAVDEARLLMTEEAPRMPLGSSVTKLLLRSPWCPRVCWGVCVSGCVCMLACVCWGVCMFWGVCVASAGISAPVSASLSWGPLMMGLALCTCPLHGAEFAHGEARALRVKWRNLSGDTASHLRAGASQVGGVIEGLAVPDGAGHLAEFSCLIVTMTPVTPKMLTVASCSRGAAAKPWLFLALHLMAMPRLGRLITLGARAQGSVCTDGLENLSPGGPRPKATDQRHLCSRVASGGGLLSVSCHCVTNYPMTSRFQHALNL